MSMPSGLDKNEALRFACLDKALVSGLSTTDKIVEAATKFESFVKGTGENKPTGLTAIAEGLRIGG